MSLTSSALQADFFFTIEPPKNSEQTLEDSEGQGSLEGSSPWGHKNWTQLSD